MKVGIAGAKPAEIALLRRVAEQAGVDIAWVAASRDDVLAARATVALVLAVHGAIDASAYAPDLAARGVAVVLVVDDAAANVESLYRAIAGGGVEVVTRPKNDTDLGAIVAVVARHARADRPSHSPARAREAPVLAIAASAGGPDALAQVLSSLSPDLALRVIVAQHIEPAFASGLASWLATRAHRRVEVADEGRALGVDCALVVRSDRQPVVDRAGVVRYRALDPANPFHPCIDTLLSSLAAAPLLRGAAALLTGMGSDGAAGLLALRAAGWITIAQDAASSRVFGMPRAAAEMGAASHVVPLDRIGPTASRALSAQRGAGA